MSHINRGKWQFIWWGRWPKFKISVYTPTTPIFKSWYFGLFEIRKFLR